MKQLNRISAPECLDNQNIDTVDKKRAYYRDLRYPNKGSANQHKGGIKQRWNELDMVYCSEACTEISSIRKYLLQMSNNECAYCGRKISNAESSREKMEVDHYLPSAKYEYLAYCWDNYLPSCHNCNSTIKKQFTPNSLKNKIIVEEIIKDEYSYDYIFEKKDILENIAEEDRLIEPSYDNIADHLEFVPESYGYIKKSKIGEVTNSKFFKRPEVEVHLEGISRVVQELVILNVDYEIISCLIQMYGYEFYYNTYYEYWTNEKKKGTHIR